MTVAEALKGFWQTHGDDPEAAFAALAPLADQVDAADVPALVGATVHVVVEHLRRPADARPRLDRIDQRFPGLPAVLRARAALDAVGSGTLEPLARLEPAERLRALAVVISAGAQADLSALVGLALSQATTLQPRLPPEADAVRAIAVASNNLACALEERFPRTPDDDANLRSAAVLARAAWERSGTWLQVERAEYRLAMSLLALGDRDAAVAHAEACLGMCRGNGADDVELGFAEAAVALTCATAGARDRAQASLAAAEGRMSSIPEGVRPMLQAELARARAAAGG